MTRRATFPVLVLLLASAAIPGARAGVSAPQRETVERHVDVAVEMLGGASRALTPADVIVREDDVAREVIRVGPAAAPTDMVLIVDNTSEAGSLLPELRAGLTKFVFSFTALPAPPTMSVVTAAERPTTAVSPTTSDIVLERGIQRIFPVQGSGSYLLDAIIEAAESLRRAKAARPAIVAFTIDGSPALSDQTHTRVADALRQAGASLWTIQLQRNAPGGSVSARERARVIGEVTAWSGGTNTPVLSAPRVEPAFLSVSAAILGRVDVVYGRPEALIPPTRLTVEARDPSAVRVSAPRWPRP